MADYEPGVVSRVSDDKDSGSSGGGDKRDRKSRRRNRREKEKEKSKDKGREKDPMSADSEDGADGEDGGKSKKQKKKEKGSDLKDTLKKAAIAGQAAQAGAHGLFMMKMFMMLKMFLQMAVQAAVAAGSAFFSGLASFVMGVVHGVAAAAAAIGISAALASGGLAVIVAIAVIGGAVYFGSQANMGQRDDMIDCNNDNSYMYHMTGASGNTLENAKKIYVFCKEYGLPDENIAGILGNFQAESGIDPTGVETIFTEPFATFEEGTRKYEAWFGSYEYVSGHDIDGSDIISVKSPANFVLSETTPYGRFGLRTYSGNILNVDVLRSYSDKYPGIHNMGIGLGQWTNSRNENLLKYADDHSTAWWDLNLQLMFMVDPNGGDERSVEFMANWGQEDSPEAAAKTWCTQWEGIGYRELRGSYAREWFTTFASWDEGDEEMAGFAADAQALLASVGAAGSRSADSAFVGSVRSCSDFVLADNTSAAAAAVSYAWGPGEDCLNNGTTCYQHIDDSIFGDGLYKSCDRTVATAIHWSETDVDYVDSSCYSQLEYLLTSPYWTEVDWGGEQDNLLPGDVLIRSDEYSLGRKGVHHTVMYVGNELIKERFGDEYNGHDTDRYCIVSGSYETKSPHVQGFTKTNAFNSSENLASYYCFRCTQRNQGDGTYRSLTCSSTGDGDELQKAKRERPPVGD